VGKLVRKKLKRLNTSRFFTTDDKRVNNVIYPIPSSWWSRFYEYAWAMQFCNKRDTVLDAACGIPHPFKFYLAANCRNAYAVDSDLRIMKPEAIKRAMKKELGMKNVILGNFRISLQYADITKLPFPDKMFNTVFCISVLEHLPDSNKAKALSEFYRMLKDDGILILTLDYPTTNFETMEMIIKNARFKFRGGVSPSIPSNAIKGIVGGKELHCFRMALQKII
jgi:ubiquinone/menaquinone biosynthesis C-methylase UbiE